MEENETLVPPSKASPSGREEFRRGRQIISAEEAAQKADQLRRKTDYGIAWGGLFLPGEEAVTHLCVVGASGSGKTMLLRLLMQSVIRFIGDQYKDKPRVINKKTSIGPSPEEMDEYEQAKAKHEQFVRIQLLANETERKNIQERNQQIQDAEKAERGKKEKVQGWFGLIFVVSLIGLLISFVLILPLLFLILLVTVIVSFVLSAQKHKTPDSLALLDEDKVYPEPPAFFRLPPVGRVEETTDALTLPYVGDGHRALIYDAKGDIVSLLHGMDLKCPVVILNPFDARSSAWDMASDITTPAAARQLGTILIPEEKSASQPFFANAARDLLTSVIIAFILIKPGQWTFRDVILAMRSRSQLTRILEKTPQTKDKIELYFSDERTASNVMAEIATRVAPFEFVAAAWSHAKEKVSLQHWLKNEYVLILGSNEEQRATLDAINRVIFQRVTELVLSQSESLTRRTWIFLDEIREAGNLDSLGRLMTKGRSKGGCVVLGFQDIEGMRDAFGKERANELVGQANNKIILRLNSSETAQWASELFGKYEFIEEETGENSGGSKTTGLTMTEGESQAETKTTGNSEGTTTGESTGKSHGTSGMPGTRSEQTSWQSSEQKSRQTSESQSTQTSTNKSKAENTSDTETWTSSINRKRMEKDAVMASQFMQMPMTNPRNGLHGYYLLPSIGAFYGVLTGDFLAGTLLSPKKSEPNYLERPPSEQYLEPWSTTELTALGLTSSTTAVVTANSPEAKVQPPSVPRPLRGSEAREATKEERAKFLSHLPKGRSQ